MKMAGIIGGMGPGTSADFYKEVNKIAEDRGETDRPELMLWNIPLNYDVEKRLLRTQQGLEQYLPILIMGAQKLEKAGADFLAMPCNTVHILYDKVVPHTTIPFLHIIDETAKHLKNNGFSRTGLFATSESLQGGLYQSILSASGIDYVLPLPSEQERIDIMVSELVTDEGADFHSRGSNESMWFTDLVTSSARRTGSAILGCTDLQIALHDKTHPSVFDSMKILAESTVDTIYK